MVVVAGRKSSGAESGADPGMTSADVGAGSTGAVVLVGRFQVSALLDSVGLLYMVGEWACCLHRGLKWDWERESQK